MINRQREKNKNQSQVYLLAITNRLAEENNNQSIRFSRQSIQRSELYENKEIEGERERTEESQDGEKSQHEKVEPKEHVTVCLLQIIKSKSMYEPLAVVSYINWLEKKKIMEIQWLVFFPYSKEYSLILT